MAKKKIVEEISTEEKIIAAARKVFLRKGFSATRTRDIAEEAGINLALLNYYFRSKQKLFEQVMREKFQKLIGHILPLLGDASTSLEQKIELIVESYIDVLSQNPDLPIFVFNELHKNKFEFLQAAQSKFLVQSSFVNQLKERRSDVSTVQFLLSILGLIIFPFIAKPAIIQIGFANEKTYGKLMQERKKLIPVWTKAILKSK